MAKTKISEYDAVAANNTDVDGINIAEGCPPSSINNAIREVMAHLKDFQGGSSGDNLTVGGNLSVTGTTTLSGTATATTQSSGDNSTKLATTAYVDNEVSGLGTISTQNANNVSITGGSITGITDLTVSDGGTGRSTLTANNVLLGNGTSAINFVAPSTANNALISNGTTWTSSGLAKSHSSSGYQTLVGGLIIQWGKSLAGDDTSYAITFPTAFPTACISITASMEMVAGSTNYATCGVGNVTSTGARLYGMVGSGSAHTSYAYWIAIGY